jgi:hypothetical protein
MTVTIGVLDTDSCELLRMWLPTVRRCIRGHSSSNTSVQYRNSVLLQQSVCKWIKKLKNGCTNVIHEERDGRPFTATNEASNEHALDMVLLDRQVITGGVTNHLQISHGSAYENIHSRLGFHKVRARWVPKQLTALHKQTHWTSANIWITMVTNMTCT